MARSINATVLKKLCSKALRSGAQEVEIIESTDMLMAWSFVLTDKIAVAGPGANEMALCARLDGHRIEVRLQERLSKPLPAMSFPIAVVDGEPSDATIASAVSFYNGLLGIISEQRLPPELKVYMPRSRTRPDFDDYHDPGDDTPVLVSAFSHAIPNTVKITQEE